MVKHETLDPLDTAIAHLISRYPVSAARFAPRNTISAYGLFNACTQPLSVKEAVALQAGANDVRLLHAEAAALGHGCVPLRSFRNVTDLDLLSNYAAWHSCLGPLLLAVTQAIHDRHMSRTDFELLRIALQDDAARGFEFLKRLEPLIHAE